MSKQDDNIGKRFSHVYIERGVPQKDSVRLRRRLSAFFVDKFRSDYGNSIAQNIHQELGVCIPVVRGYILNDFNQFFNKSDLRDVLDSITLIWEFLSLKDSAVPYASNNAEKWKNFTQRVLSEENLGYQLDEKAGVHYFVDEEFERNRLSALACLESSRYAAVAHEFKKSHSKLDTNPPETKEAVRACFEAIEILYKLITNAPEKSRLNSNGVRDKIKPMAENNYSEDPTALKVAEHLLDGLCDWIDACHMYRHGQKVEEPNNPPIELAVQMISTGAGYLRWLVEIDRLNQK